MEIQHYSNKKSFYPTFSAGVTKAILKEIENTDTISISNKLLKNGISSDFNNNKTIAWCCNKVIELIEHINKKYKMNFALPKGIFVKDFENLNIDDTKTRAFCNLRPFELYKSSEEVVPSRTIFFNNFETLKQNLSPENRFFYDWKNIDEISDLVYNIKHSPTDFFLDTFFHEFAHAIHETRLINKLGPNKLSKQLDLIETTKNVQNYRQKYGDRVKQICDYALQNQLEAVACDMSKTITESLDKNTIHPNKQPFIDTAFEKLFFWQPKRIKIPVYSDEERPLIEIIRSFWNGDFQ